MPSRPKKRRPAGLRRDDILNLLNSQDRPRPFKFIAKQLGATGRGAQNKLQVELDRMVHDGQVAVNRRGDYGLTERMDLVRGRVIGHADGFGFLKPEDGGSDLYLPAKQMRRVLHGDTALASITGFDRRGRREGQIVEVLSRHNREIVGRFHAQRGMGIVVPEDRRLQQDILVAPADQGDAVDGQIVVAEIIEQPARHRGPIGRIKETLGDHMRTAIATDVALRTHGLRTEWSEDVQHAIPDIPDRVQKPELQGRRDLRDLALVTIDGADARDFDDAVYCERTEDGYRLLVAIADVSHYVKPGSAIDDEAYERGTSAYFPDRVVPMLPEVLSNGICSLKPAQDRLCLVCEMQIDDNGNAKRAQFYPAVMHSAARLTYTEVSGIIEKGDAALREKYKKLLPRLEALNDVHLALRSARRRRGAIDFEGRDVTFHLDADGHVDALIPYELTAAHQLIEECMVAANVQAAIFLLKKKIPALYRVHEPPEGTKLEDLKSFLGEVGLQLGGGKKPQPEHFARLIEAVKGRDDQRLIQEVLLRAQSLAVYRAENLGHFGLALDAYAHFTSPIRRYPDLLVHRAIHYALKEGRAVEYLYAHRDMQAHGLHTSLTERRAEKAARDVQNWFKCAYMQRHVGDTFEGTITGVQPFGLFVELDDILVSGLVHVTALRNDYYHFDPISHRLTGERSGVEFRLADRVRVQVVRVDLDDRKVDFELVGAPKHGPGARGAKRAKGPSRKTRGKR